MGIRGGQPDMGGVSADGKVLWLSGRYNAEVYAFDTSDGHLLARIPVGKARTVCAVPAARPYRSATLQIYGNSEDENDGKRSEDR